MERSPEIVFTLDTVVGECMPKIKDSNDRGGNREASN